MFVNEINVLKWKLPRYPPFRWNPHTILSLEWNPFCRIAGAAYANICSSRLALRSKNNWSPGNRFQIFIFSLTGPMDGNTFWNLCLRSPIVRLIKIALEKRNINGINQAPSKQKLKTGNNKDLRRWLAKNEAPKKLSKYICNKNKNSEKPLKFCPSQGFFWKKNLQKIR